LDNKGVYLKTRPTYGRKKLLPLDQLAISWIPAANQDSKTSPEKKIP